MNAYEHYKGLQRMDIAELIELAKSHSVDIPVPDEPGGRYSKKVVDGLRGVLAGLLEHIDSQIGKPGDIVNAEQGLTLLADTEWSERHWLEDRYNRIVVTMGRGLHYEGDVVRPAGHGPISYVTDDGTLHVAEGENFEVCFV